MYISPRTDSIKNNSNIANKKEKTLANIIKPK